MNVAILLGNICTDPTHGETRTGDAYTRFRIAVYAGKDRSDFFTVKAFGKTAEIVAERASKGDGVAVRGRLATAEWQHEGRTMRDVEIIAERVRVLGRRTHIDDGGGASAETSDAFADIPF